MSRETSVWLNTHTLIGMTEQRGNAWHYRAADQGAESNHYPGFVPVDDVNRRLLNWQVSEAPVMVQVPAGIEDMSGIDGNGMPYKSVTVPNRKALIASDNAQVFSIFSGSYAVHQYNEWLINNVERILGSNLGISSAGLLADRGICWVEVSVPETITTPEGVSFRPNLVACTSHTGKLATTYKRTITATVCDNTLSAALSEEGQQFKVKHSSKSLNRLPEAREALALVVQMADGAAREIRRNVNWKIGNLQFKTVLNAIVPVPAESGAARTNAVRKQEEIRALYLNDKRVAPWTGTAFGVLQAFNTWDHHVARVNSGTDRGQRNTLDALTGETDKRDAEIMRVLAGV